MIQTIDGVRFKEMLLHAAAAISLEKQTINDLNVFPVPDGDTGTNMSLTIGTAATELKKRGGEKNLGAVVSTAASALLRGARGNSGVILALLFRGISKALKGRAEADGALLAAAMEEGVSAAYGAVMKPAEGTVLTVSRLSAKRASEAAKENNDVEYVLSEAVRVGWEVLAQTTDMNPVLKKAGVVDAGGRGYLVILGGMLANLRGEPMPEVTEGESAKAKADFEIFSTEEILYAFDTVFIVRKQGEKSLAPLREYLGSIGDSLVIGEDDEAFKVHVHTNIPGDALKEAQKYGTLELAKIENMRTQHDDLAAGKHVQSVDDLDAVEEELEKAPSAVSEPTKRYGFLAVCVGEGLAAVFKDLGVDGVISGGQTMNPSTESILTEINRVPAEVVYVLPNNKNIIMAAQQCGGLTSKKVMVVPTETIPQGVSAMMAVDTELEPEELLGAMRDAAKGVTTAQLTYAARNSDFDGFSINEGDYLALLEGKLYGTDRAMEGLLAKLAGEAASRQAEFVTVFYGEDVTGDQAERAKAIFTEKCPDAEISVLSGGQPVYYYIVSIE